MGRKKEIEHPVRLYIDKSTQDKLDAIKGKKTYDKIINELIYFWSKN